VSGFSFAFFTSFPDIYAPKYLSITYHVFSEIIYFAVTSV